MPDPTAPDPLGDVDTSGDARTTSSGRGGRADFVDAAREQTAAYVEQRKADAAKAISDVANSIRRSGEGFEDQPHVKAFFDNAAAGIDDLSGSIARRSFGEIYDEIETVVRQRPVVSAVAAIVAGFALVNILKGNGTRPIPRSRALVTADPTVGRLDL